MAKLHGHIQINIENCKGCELCVNECPQGSLEMSKTINKKGYHYAVLVEDNCTGCTNCALVCPEAIITVYRESKNPSADKISLATS
jgi:2-oxoglutarate ferredoxin oxidoreductase subunit delta